MANNNLFQRSTTMELKAMEQETRKSGMEQEDELRDYSKRGQWLRAAILGANDGLVSTSSLMMGVGAVKQDAKVMILTGFVGLIAGACSMAIGEFVSVYSQYDIEVAQMKRGKERSAVPQGEEEYKEFEEKKEDLPSPSQAAMASGLAFSMGAIVPLMAASFIDEYRMRVVVVVGAVTVALVVFGWVGAVLGKAPVVKSSLRVLVCGWLAMALTFGLTKCMELITTHLH